MATSVIGHDDRASSVISLSDGDEDYMRRPASKRAKVSSGGGISSMGNLRDRSSSSINMGMGSNSNNSIGNKIGKSSSTSAREIRLQQNREAAHKS